MDGTLLSRISEWFGKLLGLKRAVSMPAIYEQIWQAIDAEAQTDGIGAYLVDIYADNDGSLFAIATKDGKLWKAPIGTQEGDIILGGWVEVEMQYVPRSRFTVKRQADGSYRWFAVTETAVLLRVGELDSTALFDDMIRNAETHGYPKLLFYHDPRLEIGQADWLARDEWCYLASGTLYDNDLGQALARTQDRWGTSNGFEATEQPYQWEVNDGVTIPVYTAGIHREISVLPENNAASWFTNIGVVQEVKRMRKEVKDALVKLLGDQALADNIEQQVDGTNREIERQGMITREGDSGEEAPVADTPETTEQLNSTDEQSNTTEQVNDETDQHPEAEREVVLDESAIEALASKLGLSEAMQAINAKLDELAQKVDQFRERTEQKFKDKETEMDAKLAELRCSDDERKREWLKDMPARNRTVVSYRPRENAQAETDILDLSLEERAKMAMSKVRGK